MCDYICYTNAGLYKQFVLQEVEAPRISGQSAQEGDKFISPTHNRIHPHVISLSLIYVRCCVDPRATRRPENISQYSQ